MDIIGYSQRIIEATDAIRTARNADDALAALERLESLASDHETLRSMAVLFQILVDEFLAETNDHTKRGSKNDNPA